MIEQSDTTNLPFIIKNSKFTKQADFYIPSTVRQRFFAEGKLPWANRATFVKSA
jgi:hypothetical protein